MTEWIAALFAEPTLLRMGHLQRAADGNLGLGWLYYALGSALRPAHALVIGSWRGFVPLVLGKALAANVRHLRMTTQELLTSPAYEALPPLGLQVFDLPLGPGLTLVRRT